MSRIRTQVRLGSDASTDTAEVDVSASILHGIDVTDDDQVTATLALNHPELVGLVRAELRARGVDLDPRTVEIVDARYVPHDAPASPSLVPDTANDRGNAEGWTTTDVQVHESTTYTVPVVHPVGASAAEIAAVGYDDYCQALHPDAVFAHTAGPDEVTVAAIPQDSGQDNDGVWPRWAAQRPDHQPDPEPSPAPGEAT